MINHVRTLLLNGMQDDMTVPGEEYVSPRFKPRKLSSALAKVHLGLYGSKANRGKRNYRLRQLMTLLHATELSAYVLDCDSRVTYWPTDTDKCLTGEMFSLADAVISLNTLLTPEDEQVIFGATPEEPYKTFQQLWKTGDNIAYRLGGLILAVAYRTDEIGTH